jgi:hypothetical protein
MSPTICRAVRIENGKTIHLDREVMGCSGNPSVEVLHLDGDFMNCQCNNLRVVPRVFLTAEDWCLFSGMRGAKKAAEKLNAAFYSAVDEGRDVRASVEAVMEEYAYFGACDSEPRNVLEFLLHAENPEDAFIAFRIWRDTFINNKRDVKAIFEMVAYLQENGL